MRRPASIPLLAGVDDDLVGGDLLEGDRERLAGERVDLRGHVSTDPVTQLVEVRVDLAGAPGRQDDEGESLPGALEHGFDGRVDHHGWITGGSGTAPSIPATCPTAVSRSSLTTWCSKSVAASAIWSRAMARRRAMSASDVSPRRRSRASRASRSGGTMEIMMGSGN